MTAIPSVDLSFSELTQEKLQWLWANDFRRIEHCLWTGGYVPAFADGRLAPVHNIQAVIVSGLPFKQSGYIVVDDRRGSGAGLWHVSQARMALSDAQWAALDHAWIDVEVDDPRFGGTTYATVRDAVERIAQLGKRRAIYTRRGFWASMGDSPDFGDCLFWLANYDGNADPLAGFKPFPSCSLTNYAGKQYHNTTDADGLEVDLNTFIAEVLAPGTTTQEDDMSYPLPHVDFAPGPGQKYRSYYLSGSAVQKTWIASGDERQALVAAGVIKEPPARLTLVQLKAIPSAPGTPEPDAP